MFFNEQIRNEEQLNMMLLGGNANLQKIFGEYNISKDGEMSMKYKTKACLYYRNRV